MKIFQCRICGSRNIERVVDLGCHPLADTFLTEPMLDEPELSFPLQLGSCDDCGHIFTLFSVSREDRYQKHEYSYDSSNSQVSSAHFKEYAKAVLRETELQKDALIVDIGSNVGTLLAHFRDLGYPNILGIEPSGNISKRALDMGIPTLNEFFDEKAASQISKQGEVEVLLSANVVNHADDTIGLLQTARKVLSPTGCFVFEVPYLLDLIEGTAFDTIYHEHVHYFGIKPLANCLLKEGFSIYKIERLDYMCGSIRVYSRVGGTHSESVLTMIAEEEEFGLYRRETYDAFMQRAKSVKYSINENLWKIRSSGGKIIGIGAATKGNTLLNYCGLDGDLIDYITDASPLKIGKFTPRSRIPILDDKDIDSSATHALILPWNIASFLTAKLAHLGLEFYVPQVEVLKKSKT